jgi:hypothetical protein
VNNMTQQEYLKSMLTNIVHDREAEATVDFHNYLQSKMRTVSDPQVEEAAPTDETE